MALNRIELNDDDRCDFLIHYRWKIIQFTLIESYETFFISSLVNFVDQLNKIQDLIGLKFDKIQYQPRYEYDIIIRSVLGCLCCFYLILILLIIKYQIIENISEGSYLFATTWTVVALHAGLTFVFTLFLIIKSKQFLDVVYFIAISNYIVGIVQFGFLVIYGNFIYRFNLYKFFYLTDFNQNPSKSQLTCTTNYIIINNISIICTLVYLNQFNLAALYVYFHQIRKHRNWNKWKQFVANKQKIEYQDEANDKTEHDNRVTHDLQTKKFNENFLSKIETQNDNSEFELTPSGMFK